MYGLISTTDVAVSAALLQDVSLCTQSPRLKVDEMPPRSHLASPNTARALHAAHVHAALRGDGMYDSSSDTLHRPCARRVNVRHVGVV